MKKNCKLLALVILMLICLLAFMSCDGGDDYQFSDGTLIYREVEGGYEVVGVSDKEETHIKIPSSVKGEKVISIGEDAFDTNYTIVSIEMPDTIVSIKYSGISGCFVLENIVLSNNLREIGYGVLDNCDMLKYNEKDNGKYLSSRFNPYFMLAGVVDKELKSFEVNSRCKVLHKSFRGCENLEDVSIPKGVEVIGPDTFISCHRINNVELPDTVIFIGNNAFHDCWSLKKINIPESVKFIDNQAFYRCFSLTEITLPNSLEKIGGTPIEYTSQLKVNKFDNGAYIGNSDNPYMVLIGCLDPEKSELIIHEGTKLISSNVIGGVSDLPLLSAIHVEEGNKYFKSVEGNLYTKDGKSLIQYAWGKNEETFDVPEGVEEIGDYAFQNSTLKKIYLHDSVVKLGSGMCSNAVNLEYINLPSQIKEIPSHAFSVCVSLKNVDIPKNVKLIGNSAFLHCISLESIDLPNGLVFIGRGAFQKCQSLKNLIIPDSVQQIRLSAFEGCDSLDSVVIGSGVTSISYHMIKNCKSLKTIELTNNVFEIGATAFADCTALEKIIFNGTMEEWLAIEKYSETMSSFWNYNTGNYIVECTDGILDKNDNKTTR